MRIGEVAEQTGLSISNIRFYEKKGLIKPDREVQSQYRDYTTEDVEQLKKIILYRKLDLTIEQIAALLEEKEKPEILIRKQMELLEEKQAMLQGSIDLCNKMLTDDAFLHLDVDYYLNYVKEEEAQGKRFAEIEEFLEDFAQASHMHNVLGSAYCKLVLWNPKMKNVILVLWALGIVLLPVIVIADNILDHGKIQISGMIFCLIWITIFVGAYIKRDKL